MPRETRICEADTARDPDLRIMGEPETEAMSEASEMPTGMEAATAETDAETETESETPPV